MYFNGSLVPETEKLRLALRRQVTLLDQSPLLFTASVRKNIEFGLKMRGIAKAERKRRATAALEMVGMTRFMDAAAHKLSGGETKRVALARTLAVAPKVLLCDEPTANVDLANQQIILDILAELNRTQKTTIIFSTHAYAREKKLAHRTLNLDHGQLTESVAAPVYRLHRLGSQGERGLFSLLPKCRITLPMTTAFAKEKVDIIIDLTTIIPWQPDCGAAGNTFTGRIVRIEEEGDQIRLTILSGLTLPCLLDRDTYRHQPPRIGDQFTVFIPDEGIQPAPPAYDGDQAV
jgi:tungstate transport system ATP-binding protein